METKGLLLTTHPVEIQSSTNTELGTCVGYRVSKGSHTPTHLWGTRSLRHQLLGVWAQGGNSAMLSNPKVSWKENRSQWRKKPLRGVDWATFKVARWWCPLIHQANQHKHFPDNARWILSTTRLRPLPCQLVELEGLVVSIPPRFVGYRFYLKNHYTTRSTLQTLWGTSLFWHLWWWWWGCSSWNRCTSFGLSKGRLSTMTRLKTVAYIIFQGLDLWIILLLVLSKGHGWDPLKSIESKLHTLKVTTDSQLPAPSHQSLPVEEPSEAMAALPFWRLRPHIPHG